MNFIDELMFHSRMQPERAAIVLATGRSITWRQLGAGILNARAALERHNVRRTDLVSVEISDQIFRIVMVCALMRMGICVMSSGFETTAQSAGLGATVFLCDQESLPPPGVLPADVRIISVADDWFLANADKTASGGLNDALDKQVPYEPGLPAHVFFTSGSTGLSSARAASFLHFNTNLQYRRAAFDTVPCTRVLIIPDMRSSIGLLGALASLMSGRTVFHIKTVYVPKAVDLYAIELLIASTYLIHAITDTLRRTPFHFRSIRGVRFGGGIASPELLADVARLISPNISYSYASTEAGIVAVMPLPVTGRPTGMVGQPTSGIKIKIVDGEGNEVAPGAIGEIRIQSQHAALPFVSREVSVEPGPDDWMASGDLGFIDTDGNLNLTGRKSDVINLGGVKFLPDQVEDFLVREPGIEDAAAVSIMPRDGMIEELHIFVVTKTRQYDELRQTLHVRLGLARPHKLHLIDAIPRNRLGKIARGELRALAGRS